MKTVLPKNLHQLLHTLGGAFLNLVYPLAGIDGAGVDEVDGG